MTTTAEPPISRAARNRNPDIFLIACRPDSYFIWKIPSKGCAFNRVMPKKPFCPPAPLPQPPMAERPSVVSCLGEAFQRTFPIISAAALLAATLPAGYWLTCRIRWYQQRHLGQDQSLQSFVAAPSIFNSMGGDTKMMVCPNLKWLMHCYSNVYQRLVNLSYLLKSPAPSRGNPTSCYSMVAQGNHGQGKFL